MKTLTKSQLDETLSNNDNAILINVLPPQYFEEGHIPGSKNLPQDLPDFVEQIGAHLPKDAEIIVYCAKTECTASGDAAKKLDDAGFTNVHDFVGGMKEWQDAGGEIETGSGCCGHSCGCK